MLVQAVLQCVLLKVKDMHKIMRIVRFGSVSILLFLAFVMWGVCKNVADNGSIQNITDKGNVLNMSTFQYSQAAGFFALAFMIHSAIVPIYR